MSDTNHEVDAEDQEARSSLSSSLVTSGGTPYASATTFEDLSLSPELLKGLYVEMKLEKPSKIQAICLPMILTPPYKNLIAQAHNGLGNTTCFVLGMLSRVDPNVNAPQALCICPTRELVIQNMEVLEKMGKFTGITSESAIHADPANYISIHKRPLITAQVIIGTPGTISKWVLAKKLGMSQMKILVFDKADQMLAESGFRDDSVRTMKTIAQSNPNCQVLLFSAAFNDDVRAFVAKIAEQISVREYNLMDDVKKEQVYLDSVRQFKVHCPDELGKITVIRDKLLELGDKFGQTIIFVRTRKSAAMLCRALREYGWVVTALPGAVRQEDRNKIIKEFEDGYAQILISTDLLPCGFYSKGVNLVVNYDLPVRHDQPTEADMDVYLHRVFHAGRFGRKGAAFSLICNDDGDDEEVMSKIEKSLTNSSISEVSPWNSDEAIKLALKEARRL